VPRGLFLEVCRRFHGEVPAQKHAAFDAYLNELFDAATWMMLPAKKADLGKHCFGYAFLLSREFYTDAPCDVLGLVRVPKPNDRYSSLRAQLDTDCSCVHKDAEGRVTLASFQRYFEDRHARMFFGAKTAPATLADFRQYLGILFNACLGMMLPTSASTLGGHGFRYAALNAGEFYFPDVKVTDALGLL